MGPNFTHVYLGGTHPRRKTLHQEHCIRTNRYRMTQTEEPLKWPALSPEKSSLRNGRRPAGVPQDLTIKKNIPYLMPLRHPLPPFTLYFLTSQNRSSKPPLQTPCVILSFSEALSCVTQPRFTVRTSHLCNQLLNPCVKNHTRTRAPPQSRANRNSQFGPPSP